MGKIDDAALAFFSESDRFAEVMNVRLFGGRKFIKAEELSDADSVFVGARTGRNKPRGRVIVDKAKIWNGTCLRLLIQEYQAYIDYRMVFRCIYTESLAYHAQFKRKKHEHLKNGDLKETDEFLTGISKTDKFMPVIIVVVNLSSRKWDGEKTLYGMLENSCDELIRPFVSDYRMNILDYHDYKNLDGFTTDVKKIFEILERMDDRQKIKELLEKDNSYSALEDDTADLIEAISSMKIGRGEGGKRDMCKAWIDQRADGKAEGRAEGRAEGKAEGKAEAILTVLEDVGTIATDLREKIMSETNLATLTRWLKLAAKSDSIEAFTQAM